MASKLKFGLRPNSSLDSGQTQVWTPARIFIWAIVEFEEQEVTLKETFKKSCKRLIDIIEQIRFFDPIEFVIDTFK